MFNVFCMDSEGKLYFYIFYFFLFFCVFSVFCFSLFASFMTFPGKCFVDKQKKKVENN